MSNSSDIRTRAIYRITIIGLVTNVLLFAFKLVAGVLGRSSAMVADAVHSASDFVTDIIVLLCVRISRKPRDKDHDWGHGKYETFASLLIALALAAVGIELLVDNSMRIAAVTRGEVLPRPGVIALVAAAVSIVAKEVLFRYTIRVGRQFDSPSVVANSWHHRSDALSSIGTLIGVGAAYFLGAQWRIADPVAAIVVAALILKVAFDIIKTSLGELLEKSLSEDTEQRILDIVTSCKQVHDPHNLRTRRIGSDIAVDLHIRVEGSMSVEASHEITRHIEQLLKAEFGDGTYVAIHVEPKK